MSKKILIVTDCFPPNFAPRMGVLSTNLEKMEWDVTIISEDNAETHYALANLPQNTYLYNYQSSLSRVGYYFKTALNLFFDHKSLAFYKRFSNVINNGNFDLVLCSTFNEFPLNLAYKISQKLNIPLVCDIRDLVEQFGNKLYSRNHISDNFFNRFFTNLIRKKRICKRNQIIKKANAVVTVSPWHKEFLSRLNKNVHLIYNGYSSELFTANDIKSDTFDIIYTGRLLDSKAQNPELLFKAIEALRLEKLRLVWYVDNKSKAIINDILKDYPTSRSISQVNNLVPVSEIPTLLNKSSIVLVLTNKSDENGPKGIMTTKFFEAIGVEKPVLCVPNDEGCLGQVINEVNAGLAANSAQEVQNFITEKYNEWQKNGFTRQNVRNKEYFCRENQAKEFIKVFNTVL